MTRTRKPGVSRRATLAMMGAGAVTFAAPWVARAQAKTIKIGMPTILSGRVAQLGTSSRNAVMLEVDKVNAAGGLAGRQIEMVIRDSKGQPQEAARIARELVNTDGCEMLLDARGVVGSVRGSRGRARSWRALHSHQLGNLLADGRSEAAHPERVPLRAPGHPRLDRRRQLCRGDRQGQGPEEVGDLLRRTTPMAAIPPASSRCT